MSPIIVFTCNKCTVNQQCISCKQKKSVFNVGYKDGKLNNPKETTGFDQQQTGIYHAGYIQGIKDRV